MYKILKSILARNIIEKIVDYRLSTIQNKKHILKKEYSTKPNTLSTRPLMNYGDDDSNVKSVVIIQ